LGVGSWEREREEEREYEKIRILTLRTPNSELPTPKLITK
jgi:hypothetical protein